MKTIFAISLVILLFGCSNQPSATKSDVMQDAREFSVVSVTSPGFNPTPGQSVAWFSPIIWASEAVQADPHLSQEVMGFIEEELRLHGFTISQNPAAADYVIGAAVADGTSELSQELQHFFSLFPSIGESHSKHAKSTFYVGMIHARDLDAVTTPRGSAKVLWRSSIQAYILGDDVSTEFRDQRLRVFAGKLMKSLP